MYIRIWVGNLACIFTSTFIALIFSFCSCNSSESEISVPPKAIQFIKQWESNPDGACLGYMENKSWIGLSKNQLLKVLIMHGVNESKISYPKVLHSKDPMFGSEKEHDEVLNLTLNLNTINVFLNNCVVVDINGYHPID